LLARSNEFTMLENGHPHPEAQLKTPCRVIGCLGFLACAGFAVPAEAEPGDVVVTATRIPEPADEVPAFISVVPHGDLRIRGVTDLATAMSLVPGTEAPPGGDAGPSSAVPSLWGLHEFDAFLLVVDGRYLDEQNAAPVGGYTTVDANVGYSWKKYRLSIDGTNLTNQRPPVTSSEFGSQSFYFLPARMIWLRLGLAWR